MGDSIVVGRIGRAHGIRGDLAVAVHTDVPDRRFAHGARVHREDDPSDVFVVESSRWHSGRFIVHFSGVDDRGAAEALAGVVLAIDVQDTGPADDGTGDVWWDRDLVGLAVSTVDGADLGKVLEVVHAPAGDLLAIVRPDGRELLVPFVRAIVPVVDPVAGTVVVDPPPGLLDLA